MIDGLRSYPEMMGSGVEWLPALPEGWEIHRAKYSFREADDRSEAGDEELLSVSHKTGVTPRSQKNITMFMAESYEGHKVCRPDDIVVNTMWAWMAAIGVSRHVGIVSPAYGIYRPRTADRFESQFLDYLLRTEIYRAEYLRSSRGVTTSRLRLYPPDFLNIPFVQPPLDEQRRIVRFLDWHGAQTAKLIRTKKKIIALLNEQKQAIIYGAVTRGLDPNAKLKPSGIPWIGDVPEAWAVKMIKRTAKILRGKFSHRPRNDPSLYDGPYPFIQTGAVARASMYIREYSQTLNQKGLLISKLFPKGTLCMTIAANIGDVAILDFDACFPDSVVGFVPLKMVELQYLYLVLKCMKSEFIAEAPVNTQGNLNVDRIGAMYIALPKMDEQRAIVQAIATASKTLDEVIERTKSEITLIQEFRTRLIADVVTGKLDVRAAASSLPEITEFDPIENLVEEDDLDETIDDAENEEVAA
jgi:type I restriction enzyme S subunit